MSAGDERPLKLRRVSVDEAIPIDRSLFLITVLTLSHDELLSTLAELIIDTFPIEQVDVACKLDLSIEYHEAVPNIPGMGFVEQAIDILVKDSTLAECAAFVDAMNFFFPQASTVRLYEAPCCRTGHRSRAIDKPLFKTYPPMRFSTLRWFRSRPGTEFARNTGTYDTFRFKKLLQEKAIKASMAGNSQPEFNLMCERNGYNKAWRA